jgi:nucleoside-triphosphatase
MNLAAKNLFLTGPPGIGKTTVIQKTVERLSVVVRGFYTRELREGSRRVGFSIITLDGKEGILAHVGATGKHRVGRYTVNVQDIERLAAPAMTPTSPHELIVIDEVGKMECFSEAFRKAVLAALDSSNRVLGTIAAKGSAFIESIKQRNDVSVLTVTQNNRDSLPEELAEKLR